MLIAASDDPFDFFQRGIAIVFTINYYHRPKGTAAQAVYRAQGKFHVRAGLPFYFLDKY